MQTQATLESGPDDGLFEIVLAAASAAAAGAGSVGIVELTSEKRSGGIDLSIEAEFGYRDGKRVLGSLETRARVERSALNVSALLREALQRFGGTRLTNLCIGREGVEGMDVTVSFGSRIPFLAENVLLTAEPLAVDIETRARILAVLGVSTRDRDGTISTPRKQIRRSMTADRQVAAYRAARDAGCDATLYAAAIPCTTSLFLGESGRGVDTVLDLVLSRGLTPSYTCTSADAQDMENLLSVHLGARFASEHWAMTHSFGEGRRDEPSRTRRGLKWFRRSK